MSNRPTPSDVRNLPRGAGLALIGGFLAAWAVFLVPYAFGPAAMICGGLAVVRGERRGYWVVIAGFVCMGLGLLLGLLPDKFAQS